MEEFGERNGVIRIRHGRRIIEELRVDNKVQRLDKIVVVPFLFPLNHGLQDSGIDCDVLRKLPEEFAGLHGADGQVRDPVRRFVFLLEFGFEIKSPNSRKMNV